MVALEAIKELRTRTGCGVADCRAALAEAGGDVEQAIIVLRQKGKATAAKKAGRQTREGIIAAYVHTNQKVAVLISLLCETDFVARSERFQTLARDVALHIAAADPLVIEPDDVPEVAIKEEEGIARAQATGGGKPAAIQEKIIAGKLKKYREERALLTQPFVKDPHQTVGDLISAAVSELGENITVGEFTRLAL